MSLSDTFKTNKDKELNGVEIQAGVNDDGSIPTFIVARASKTNKPYQLALANGIKPIQHLIKAKVNDASEKLDKVFVTVFCNVLLKGWSNVLKSDVTGEPEDKGFIEFSKQNALALFNRLPDLYEHLSEQANELSLFADGDREESAKN